MLFRKDVHQIKCQKITFVNTFNAFMDVIFYTRVAYMELGQPSTVAYTVRHCRGLTAYFLYFQEKIHCSGK